MTKTLRNQMVCWTPGPHGKLALVDWPDEPDGVSDAYDFTDGACWLDIHRPHFTFQMRVNRVLTIAMKLIIFYDMNPELVHRVLWNLKEYREAFPESISCGITPCAAH